MNVEIIYSADSISFMTHDGSLSSSTETVSQTMTPVNDPPVSSGQSVTTAKDTAAVTALSATDIDSALLTFEVETPLKVLG